MTAPKLDTQDQRIVKPSLTLKRRLRALPAQVYSAWTEPEKVKRWFGPGGVQIELAEFDTRVGGRYRIVGRSPAEKVLNYYQRYGPVGALGPKAFSAHPAGDRHNVGWTGALDKLERYFA